MLSANRPYNSCFRIFCFILALHFFNCSIDSKDPNPDFIPENLLVNDIESVAELVAEVVFGLENAFAEHDEADHEHSSFISIHKLFLVNAQLSYSIPVRHAPAIKHFIKACEEYSGLSKQISTPPPRG